MLSIQYYPFGCQNGQQNRQHASLRISLDNPRSLVPMLSVHAVHFALQSSFHAQNSIMSCGAGRALSTRALSISRMDCVRTLPERWVHTVLVVFAVEQLYPGWAITDRSINISSNSTGEGRENSKSSE
jgi:hypothetical protein